ncbi:MAG: hypothetical protein ACK4Y7_00870 [Caldimicrobium sp.]
MYWYLIGIFLWLLVVNGYAAHNLIIKDPEIYPEKEFAYLRKPILKFLNEKLLPYEKAPIKKEGTKVLESIFNFDLSGKAQIKIKLRDSNTYSPIYEKNYETTFENFWTTLEKVARDIEEKLGYKEEGAFTKGPLQDPKKEPSPNIISKRENETYYHKQEEKPSLLSRINPFRMVSQLLPKKKDSLKIKLVVPPPPPPPTGGHTYSESSNHIKGVLIPTVEEKSISGVDEKRTTRPKEKGNNPWQWY